MAKEVDLAAGFLRLEVLYYHVVNGQLTVSASNASIEVLCITRNTYNPHWCSYDQLRSNRLCCGKDSPGQRTDEGINGYVTIHGPHRSPAATLTSAVNPTSSSIYPVTASASPQSSSGEKERTSRRSAASALPASDLNTASISSSAMPPVSGTTYVAQKYAPKHAHAKIANVPLRVRTHSVSQHSLSTGVRCGRGTYDAENAISPGVTSPIKTGVKKSRLEGDL